VVQPAKCRYAGARVRYVYGTPIVVAAACSRTGDLGETDDRSELPVEPGYGLSLWSRVATATSTLTINVSKAWASNIVAYSGERTSSGTLPLVRGII
jgi:hypothetical protein